MGKSKIKGLNLGLICALVAIVFAIVAICMLFAPAAVTNDTTYSGANLAFGYTVSQTVVGATVSVKVFNASANIITYVLVLVGIVFAVLALLGKLGKIAPLVTALAFLVAGIFFFLNISFCSPWVSDSITGDLRTEAIDKIKEALSLGAGAIVGGIFSILAALASAANVLLAKK